MATNVKQNYTSPVFSIFNYLYYNSWKPLNDFTNKPYGWIHQFYLPTLYLLYALNTENMQGMWHHSIPHKKC